MFAQRQYRMGELNWSRSLLIVFVHLMGVAALILILSGTVPPETMYLAILWYTIHGLSITAGDHRLYSHCSYKARWPLHALFFLTGPGAFQGVRIWWSGKHREHHAFDGSDRDPHTINRGFWFAHVLWLIHRTSEPPQIIVSDLNRNAFVWIGSQPWVYLVTGVTVGFIIPMVIAGWFWDDMVGALFVAGFLRLTLNWNVTWLVNSLAHFVGPTHLRIQQETRDGGVGSSPFFHLASFIGTTGIIVFPMIIEMGYGGIISISPNGLSLRARCWDSHTISNAYPKAKWKQYATKLELQQRLSE